MNTEDRDKLKQLIIDKYQLGIKPEELDINEPLVNFGIGLDSVSNLEFILELEKNLGIEIDESSINGEILYNFRSLTDYLCRINTKSGKY